MEFTAQQKQKLDQATQILTELGLPSAQCNDRSGWVFLALADVRPSDDWSSATAPLLRTVDIMQFIRTEYGMDYQPNSRETIRRQTLHQFEQARVIDRNRDDPSRATNSGKNNYSLNQPILDILEQFPDGDWRARVQEFRAAVPGLTTQYEHALDVHRIPITLPNGETVSLSPGKHNQLHADIVHRFCSRFIGGGARLLYMGDTASSRKEGGKLMVHDAACLEQLGVSPMSHDKLPDVVVYDEEREWLFLIEAVTNHGPVSLTRWNQLEEAFRDCKIGIVYVTAFPDRAEFRRHAAEIAWETEVWIADDPDHMIHFNGERFLGPHK